MQEAIDIHEYQICFIMNNSAVHCSNDSTSYLKETKWSWFFLPQYVPELAPVGLFFWQLKRLISSSRQQAIMDVEKQSGVIRLAELINSIEWVTVKPFVQALPLSKPPLCLSPPVKWKKSWSSNFFYKKFWVD